MDRHTGSSSGTQNPLDLQRRIDDLDHKLGQRDRSLRELETLVQRQLAMLERYDSMLSAMPAPAAVSGSGPAFQRDYERLVELVDRAVARAEQLQGDKLELERQLDRSLGLLEESLRKQEALAAAPAAAAPVYDSVESTLAKYDAMLERSLAQLEKAYSANRDKDREIEERDRLLSRTLDALESAVDEEGAGPRGPLFNRLFS